eukprot:jgi/Chlat1/8193/Chrsp76S00612
MKKRQQQQRRKALLTRSDGTNGANAGTQKDGEQGSVVPPEVLKQMQEAYAEALKVPGVGAQAAGMESQMMNSLDPKVLEEALKKNPQLAEQFKAMQSSMDAPDVAQQLAAIQQQLQQNPGAVEQMKKMTEQFTSAEMQEKLKKLKDDEELQAVFEDIAKNGPQALMKYWNDPATLKKISAKMGGNPEAAAAAAAAASAGPAPNAPTMEVNNLIDAAKFGDVEAAEDFLAVGRDVNEADKEGRTPLHFSVAYSQPAVFEVLVAAGAKLNATDSKQNTPLHYAAGYGRSDFIKPLLDAGADTSAKNSTGKTPYDLATIDQRNPLSSDEEALALLKPKGSGFFQNQE